MSYTIQLQEEKKELAEALDFCCRMLEMLCPDTGGTPAAQNGREVLERVSTPPSGIKRPESYPDALWGRCKCDNQPWTNPLCPIHGDAPQCICPTWPGTANRIVTAAPNPLCPVHGDVRETGVVR